MFEIIPVNTKIPFMKFKGPMVLFSLLMTLAAVYFIVTKGFRYGVDFAGGVQMVLEFPKDSDVDAQKLRETMEKVGFKDTVVQSFGTQLEKIENQFMVHFPADFLNDETVKQKLGASLQGVTVTKFKFVGLEKAYMTLSGPAPIESLRKSLENVSFGMLKLLEVNPFGRGTQNEYQLSFSSLNQVVTTQLGKAFPSSSGQEVKALRVEFVGAKVGGDLRWAALLSLLVTTALIFVYIFVRFDLAYAPGVVVALVHDVTITAGFFAMTGMEFDLTVVAALLTLAGYSINDTIIVYDRIREISGQMKGKAWSSIINLAVNQTLGRTIITSGTTFLATLALWWVGGPVIHGFATAFLIGIIVGTYSSVFVAAPLVLWMQKFVGGSESRSSKAAA